MWSICICAGFCKLVGGRTRDAGEAVDPLPTSMLLLAWIILGGNATRKSTALVRSALGLLAGCAARS